MSLPATLIVGVAVTECDVSQNLTGVWYASNDDVWAVGRTGVIVHWDGSLCSTVLEPYEFDTDYLWGIWGSSGEDILAAGRNGAVFHWDGINWTDISRGLRCLTYPLCLAGITTQREGLSN